MVSELSAATQQCLPPRTQLCCSMACRPAPAVCPCGLSPHGGDNVAGRQAMCQGVPPAAFASRGIDAHLLLSLADEYMQGPMALDEVTVMKVRRIQRAHQMFNAMDSQDGKVDGCVRQLDADLYLKNMANQRPPAASEIASRVFQELQVPNTEPICFMQFVHAYPWLSLELEAFMPMPQQTGSGGAGSAVPPTRASNGYKRQRLGENSANVAGTGAGVNGAIELE
ncbi:MAG: hypothetical protein WDW38_002416 [Sanguina aurantia]